MTLPADERGAALCARVIRDGGVAIIPTDTVYGFAADACNADAVERIYRIKGRERDKPFLVLIPDSASTALFSDIPIPEKVRPHVPGPLTFILPLASRVTLSFATGTIALRIPNDIFLAALLRESGPIVAPSANPAGEPVIASIAKLRVMYEDAVDIIIDGGDREGGLPSTLYDCANDRVIRQGSIRL